MKNHILNKLIIKELRYNHYGKNVKENTDIQFQCLVDIEAVNLKKGMFFNPDPYVKMSVLPGRMCPQMSHHVKDVRTSVCSSTTNPAWRGQVSSLCVGEEGVR